MAKIETYKYRIEEAFSHSFFIIPDYQREYVWQEEEVTKLLLDIADESYASDEYFIGTILVSDTQDKKLEVIDGQQRLTTLFLTLCALKHLLGEASDFDDFLFKNQITPYGAAKPSHRLELCYEGAEHFCKIAAQAPSYDDLKKQLIEMHGKLFGSLENLTAAYQNIIHFLQDKYSNHGELDVEALRCFWGYLANSVVFIQIKADISRGLKIFETINDRGVRLNSMDLLKNLLFRNVESKDFGDLKRKWKEITKPLEKNKAKPLRFLRYYLMGNYSITGMGKKKEPIIREDQIYDWLTDKENAEKCGYEKDPFSFVNELKEGVTTYINFSKGKDRNGEDSVPLDNLRKLCGGAFSLHFILLLVASKLPDDLFDYLVRQLESFLFYFIITKSASRDLERSFSLWADELREITSEKDKTTQEQKLIEFVKRRLSKGVSEKSEEFEYYFKQLNYSSQKKYRMFYVLAKLTQYADMQFKGIKQDHHGLSNYTELEVEHILPNTPKADLRKEFEEQNPKYDYDETKNRLGNLTLLEKPLNIVAGRKPFDEKKPLYKKSANYLTRSISAMNSVGKNTSINRINKLLKSYDEWGVPEIEERQNALVELAKEVWSIEEVAE